jgi:hypothetical protein
LCRAHSVPQNTVMHCCCLFIPALFLLLAAPVLVPEWFLGGEPSSHGSLTPILHPKCEAQAAFDRNICYVTGIFAECDSLDGLFDVTGPRLV